MILVCSFIFIFLFLHIHLESIFPPVFGHRLQAKVAKCGERIVMDIEVSGTPQPEISFFKDDKPLEIAQISAHKLSSSENCHKLVIEKGKVLKTLVKIHTPL